MPSSPTTRSTNRLKAKAGTLNATKPDFSLRNWIDFYTQEFNVLTPSLMMGEYQLDTLVNKYDQMIKLMDDRADEDRRMAEIRERVVGPNLIRYASPAYWQWKTRQQLNIDPLSWEMMTLKQQGEAIAFTQLDNRVETYHRYYMELKRPSKPPGKPGAAKKPVHKPARRRRRR